VTQITLEQQLLLCCTRSAINPEYQAEVISFLEKEPEINWQNFLKLAADHRVIPLVGRSLQAISPPEISQELKAYIGKQTRQSLLLTKELLSVLQILEKEGILAVPFKGAWLAAFAYGNIAHRDFADLDILLHRADLPKAIAVLLKNRYRDRYEFTLAERTERWEKHHEWDLIKDNGLVALDLHWGFTERPIYFPLKLEDLQPRLERFNLVGKPILSLSATDALLILCINGSKECWSRLSRVCDIAALISRHQSINWSELLEIATQLGSRRMVFLGLILAKELMGTVLPEPVLKSMQNDNNAILLASEIEKQIFNRIYQPMEPVEVSRYYLQMRERSRDRFWYIYHTLKYSGWLTPTPRDREEMNLPEVFSFLYYFIRPIRVLRKYGLGFLKH
jgi:hypothetical protein